MQEKHLFEYAVIRVVPRVEREEFLNVGIILYCAKLRFLKVCFELDEQRLSAFKSRPETEELQKHLESFTKICKGGKEGGTIGEMDLASRFRWLTAMRSTVIQTSRAHPGLCSDADKTMEKLYAELVL